MADAVLAAVTSRLRREGRLLDATPARPSSLERPPLAERARAARRA